MENKECVCGDGGGKGCGMISPVRVYCCTRPKGHDGDHVACSHNYHYIEQWPNIKDRP